MATFGYIWSLGDMQIQSSNPSGISTVPLDSAKDGSLAALTYVRGPQIVKHRLSTRKYDVLTIKFENFTKDVNHRHFW